MFGVQHTLGDLRHGLRLMRRSPGLSAIIILALALGVSATTAMFTVVHAVILSPPPFLDSHRLVRVFESNPDLGFVEAGLSGPGFGDLRVNSRTLSGAAAFQNRQYDYRGADLSETLRAAMVSAGFFDLLGVRPIIGREFNRDEELAVNGRVAIISEGLWRRQLGGDPNVVGRLITLSDRPYEVVGVMPAGVPHVDATSLDVWLPIPIDLPEGRQVRFLSVVGRLAPGVQLEEARAELAVLAAQLARAYPEVGPAWLTQVVPLREHLIADVQPLLLSLSAAVACVLLIACASVANLLLSRAVAREREIAVRVALGAGRRRLASQLLLDHLPLGLLGGAGGLLLAAGALRAIGPLLPESMPRLSGLRMDGAVLAFTLVTTLVTVVLVSLVPARHAFRPSLTRSLAGGRRRPGVVRPRGLLAVAEIAAAIVLLASAGLLLRSMLNLQGIDLGFQSTSVLTLRVKPDWAQQSGGRVLASFYQELFDRIEALPVVTTTGGASTLPMAGGRANWPLRLLGTETGRADREAQTSVRLVAGDYFGSLGIPFAAGRPFDARDSADVARVLIVDEDVARALGTEPAALVGRDLLDRRDRPHRVVGVVGTVKDSFEEAALPKIYMPHLQALGELRALTLAIRTESPNPAAWLQEIRKVAFALDPRIIVDGMSTMDQVKDGLLATRRFTVTMLGGFAVLALLLAGLGVYGVVSSSVSQRTRELGIRRALGARHADLARLVVGDGLRLAAIGVAVGVGLTVAVGQLLRNQLYGVSWGDPVTFLLVAGLLAASALAACVMPARRAMRADPNVALRQE